MKVKTKLDATLVIDNGYAVLKLRDSVRVPGGFQSGTGSEFFDGLERAVDAAGAREIQVDRYSGHCVGLIACDDRISMSWLDGWENLAGATSVDVSDGTLKLDCGL